MKTRTSFVSNSSSSSFIIPLELVTAKQVQQILEHSSLGASMGLEEDANDAWTVEVTGTVVRGCVSMDNFDMEQFFHAIGVPPYVLQQVVWSDWPTW